VGQCPQLIYTPRISPTIICNPLGHAYLANVNRTPWCCYNVTGVVISPWQTAALERMKWLSYPMQINDSCFFSLAFIAERALPTNLNRYFQASTLLLDGCARSGGPLQGATRVPPSADVMKTPIKIMKREDRKVTHDVAISSTRTNRPRTTEVTVKSWIIESRERRRADLNRLQNAVLSKEIAGVTHG
jgi:hypothetical protein